MSYEITEYDKGFPVLRIRVGNREISFAIHSVQPLAREWMGEVLDRQITQLVKDAENTAIERHKAELRKLLGVAQS